jgi:hypothetical protein
MAIMINNPSLLSFLCIAGRNMPFQRLLLLLLLYFVGRYFCLKIYLDGAEK